MLEEGTREESLILLKNSIKSAEELVIVDGYFFSIKRLNQASHDFCEKKEEEIKRAVEEIITILPTGLRKLLIVTKKSAHIEEVVNKFKENITQDCIVEIIILSTIHDRVWIVDKEKYLVSGTSFNGLGKSFSFLYTIKEERNKERVAKYFRDRIKRNKILNLENTALNMEVKERFLGFFRNERQRESH